MNTNNEDSGTRICPYCAEDIKQAANKCKHCGEFLVEEENSVEIKIDDNEPTLQSKSNIILIVLFLGAVFFHILFSVESLLLFISGSYPIASIGYSLGYSIPIMIISIIILVPLVNIITKDNLGKGYFKGFTLKSITIALCIGAAIRLLF